MPKWMIEGILAVIDLLSPVGIIAGLVWSFVLRRKYEGPYILKAANSKEKWRWAIHLALFETSPFVLVVLLMMFAAAPNLESNDLVTRFSILIYCILPTIAIFPITILFERWGMEQKLREYIRLDQWRRDPSKQYFQRIWQNPLNKAFRILAPHDYARFLEQGYPDEKSNG